MKKILIYSGSKTPTQSGKLKTKFWYLKFQESPGYDIDLMTGWKGVNVPSKKIKLKFLSLESAISYAKEKRYEYEVIDRKVIPIKIKSYSDNFKYNRNKSDLD